MEVKQHIQKRKKTRIRKVPSLERKLKVILLNLFLSADFRPALDR